MAKNNWTFDDETERLIRYYLNHSEDTRESLMLSAVKSYISDRLTAEQMKHARQHTGKDAFDTQEIMRTFSDSWIEE
ncbi:hypothetical protein [Lactobacillus sp. PV034]|uniref:hypothetical protein n=1 Tax=Lactobacillus sp. PV034 TaxID=2594495 RepID=UPI002240A428|nr:hypothetical protein [Lactobacillus sp. PV034]QNQ81205.1 hypothetical protein FP432_06380 [Lactobacillus sp. PV034]